MKHKKTTPTRVSRRYSAGATRRRRYTPTPGFWRRVFLVGGIGIVTIAIALLWGSALKRRSDEHRASQIAGEWTAETVEPLPQISVPDVRGQRVEPGGTTGSTLADTDSALVWLSQDENGRLWYRTNTAETAGQTIAEDAPGLASEISRLHGAGLRVIGLFEVKCLNQTENTSGSALRRGLELSLLTAAAEAGADELLLIGCPWGTDDNDTRSLAFLHDLKELLAEAAPTAAVGVALPPDAFQRTEDETLPAALTDGTDETDDDPLPAYNGWQTPGRFLSVCDYLALDIRTVAVNEADDLLRGFRFSYNRYGLRLLISDADVSELADERGMRRQLVWGEPKE